MHEANITTKLYIELTNLGYKCELEYKTAMVVIDLIVWFKKDVSILVGIEVKKNRNDCAPGSDQHDRYKMLPLPFFVCRGMREIPYTIRRINEIPRLAVTVEDIKSVKRYWYHKPRLKKTERIRKWLNSLYSDINLKGLR